MESKFKIGTKVKALVEVDMISFPVGSKGIILDTHQDTCKVEFISKYCTCTLWMKESELKEVKPRGQRKDAANSKI